MANNPNAKDNLRPPFSATNQPKNKNGRKPSTIKRYIKDNGIDARDVSSMMKFLLPMTQKQIGDMVKNEEVPFAMRLFARSLMDDMRKGHLSNVLHVLDRAIGKSVQHQEISGIEMPEFIGFVTAKAGGDGDEEIDSAPSED